jgi:exosortase
MRVPDRIGPQARRASRTGSDPCYNVAIAPVVKRALLPSAILSDRELKAGAGVAGRGVDSSTLQRTGMATLIAETSHVDTRRSVAPLIVAAAFVPSLVAYYGRLWSSAHYQFFPLAFVGAALLARRAASAPFEPSSVRPRVAAAWIAGGLLLLAVAVLFGSPWLACVAAFVAAGARLYARGGSAGVARFLPAGLMLLVTLRLPLGADTWFITWLQQITARAASAALDIFGVTHVLSGNVVEIPGRRMFVEEACSGVNSLFSASACTLFYLLWTRRHWFVWLVLLASVPLWVLMANTVRITAVVGLRARWNIAADEGLPHQALGLIVFAAIVLLVYATERLLTFYSAVLPPEDLEVDSSSTSAAMATDSPSSARGSPLPPPWNKAPSWHKTPSWNIAAVVAALLLAVQLPTLDRDVRDLAAVLRSAPIDDLDASFLPETLDGYRRIGHEHFRRDRGSALGEHSQTWNYVAPDARGVFSLDYPFLGWHELSECYTAQGWRIESRRIVDLPSVSRPCVAVDLRHDETARFGRLYFTLLARDGRIAEPRKHGEWDELSARIAARARSFAFWNAADDRRHQLTYQVQWFVEAYAPISESLDAAPFATALGRLLARWPEIAP